MAHLHHQVDEVGKPPHKALDLKKVESMIESCKHLTAKSAVLGSGQSTECAPLELNDLSIDMEWNELGGGSSSTTNAANGKNGVKARKVFDEIFKQGNRGAQSDGMYKEYTFCLWSIMGKRSIYVLFYIWNFTRSKISKLLNQAF